MKQIDIEGPIRLGRVFWLTFAIVAAPVTWVVHRWMWHEPLYSDLAAILLLTFVVALVLYDAVLIVMSFVFGGPEGHRKARHFLWAVAGVGIAMWASWILFGGKHWLLMDSVAYGTGRFVYYLFYPGGSTAAPKPETDADFEAFNRAPTRREPDQ